MKEQPKIAVFVDGNNFFYAQRDALKWWIDPGKLLNWVQKKGDVIDAHYYAGVEYDSFGQDGYLKALTYMGYSVREKEVKVISRPQGDIRKANLSTDIVMDMFNTIDTYDLAVLVSGDSEFFRSLETLKSRGKQIFVISTDNVVSHEIRGLAGMHYCDFDSIRSEIEKVRRAA